MEGKYFVAGCAVLTIGGIVIGAVMQGINGVVISSGIGAITLIVGYGFGYNKGKKET